MGTQAGVGMSHHRDPQVAGREAAEKALAAAGIEKPDFVFMFAAVGYDQQTLLAAVREATAGAPLCGCSGWGVIAGDEADESDFSVGVMTIRSDRLRFSNGIVTGIEEDQARAGRALAKAVQPDINSDALALFLFPDGRALGFEHLLPGLEGELELDRLLPALGGSAGDNFTIEATKQYCNDQVVSNGLAWALLSGQAQVTWAASHGCVPLGLECEVTRCEGNIIHEIDGKPARDWYKEFMTEDELGDPLRVALTFYYGFKMPGRIEGYGEYIIREQHGPLEVVAEGSIILNTEVSEGTRMWMFRRDYDALAQGAERVAEEIKTQLGDNPARLVLQFDCATRGSKLYIREQQKLQLLEAMRRKIGLDVPWLGFYTFGEIAPLGEKNYWHNMAIVLAVIY
jgi:hypothetical protein